MPESLPRGREDFSRVFLKLCSPCWVSLMPQLWADRVTLNPTVLQADSFMFVLLQPKTTVDDYIRKLFTKADHNRDGRLKFTEFLTTLSLIVIEAHKRSHQGHTSHDHGQDHGHDHGN